MRGPSVGHTRRVGTLFITPFPTFQDIKFILIQEIIGGVKL
jgi:hypothetical protein